MEMVLINPNIIKKLIPLKGTLDILLNVTFYAACHNTSVGLQSAMMFCTVQRRTVDIQSLRMQYLEMLA